MDELSRHGEREAGYGPALRPGKLWIELEDGRELGFPLSTFPRLASAKPTDLETWKWIDGENLVRPGLNRALLPL